MKQEEEKHMKKRMISLMLTLSILFGAVVPAMTPQADAVIGTIIGTGVKILASVARGCAQSLEDDKAGKYDSKGKAVLGCFTNIGKDLLGMGGSSGGSTTVTVDLSAVNQSLGEINGQLAANSIAIYQLQDMVAQGVSQLTGQMNSLEKQLNELGTTVKDSAQRQEYYTYLNTFFEFFNQYYEALGTYDKLITPMLTDASTGSGASTTVDSSQIDKEYQKNLFDQFYGLETVEYSGGFYSAVDKLGRYLQGTYLTTSPGGVASILCKYYISAYTYAPSMAGKSQKEIRQEAAKTTEDMLSYIYYAYVMGIYYEQAIGAYQTAYNEENGTNVYKTDFGAQISQTQIDSSVTQQWRALCQTIGCMLVDLRSAIAPEAAMELVYIPAHAPAYEEEVIGDYLVNRTVPVGGFDAEYGAQFWIQDPADTLPYFSSDFRDLFRNMASYSAERGMEITGNRVAVVAPESGQPPYSENLKLEVRYGDVAVDTITVHTGRSVVSGDGSFAAGFGTQEYPYLIESEQQFKNLLGNSKYWSSHFVLARDLDLKNETLTHSMEFKGSFDGHGFTIKNASIGNDKQNTSEDISVGLFGKLYGTVRNLKVENVSVRYEASTNGSIYAGVLAGSTEAGVLEYCRVYGGTVYAKNTNTGLSGQSVGVAAGGAVGFLEGDLRNKINARAEGVSCFKTSVTAYAASGAASVAGGFAGQIGNRGDIMFCGYGQSGSDQTIEASGANLAVTQAGGLAGDCRNDIEMAWLELCSMPKANKAGTMLGYTSGHFKVFYYLNGGIPEGAAVVADGMGYKTDEETDYKLNAHVSDKSITEALKKKPLGYPLDFTPYVDEDSGNGYAYGMTPSFRTWISEANTNSLRKAPTKTTYSEGEYLNLNGIRLWEGVGTKVLDNVYQYGRISANYAAKVTNNQSIGYYVFNGYDADGTKLTVTPHTHTYVEDILKRPDCTQAGEKNLTCITCGDGETNVAIEALGHDPVADPAVPATCTAKGLTEGSHCKRCGEVLTAQKATALAEHTLDAGTVVAEATCVASGLKQYSCTECGRLVRSETVPATGHSYAATVNDPTCDTPGFTTHTCSACGDTYTDGYVAPTGHSYDDGTVTKEATCQALGEITYACTECGKSYTAPIPKAEHDFVADTVVEPGCDTEGYTIYKCSYGCGASEKRDFVQPTEHAYDSGTITKAATCTEEGEITYKCIHPDCTNSYTQPIPMIPHNYTETVTEPTCEEMGYTTRTCTECGDSYQTDFRNPVGHEYDQGTVTTAPTCKDEGVRTFNCVHGCGKTYTQPEPKLQHDYGAAVTEPTCEELGYTLYTCKVCGDSYMDLYTAAKGHSWGPGETVKAPTLTETGLLKQTCTLCQKTQETVIPCLDQCDGIHCPSAIFNDVKGPQNWSHVGIDYVVAMKLFNGTGATTFSPDANMTRAMLVTVLYRMEGSPSVEGMQNPFGDVAAGSWYADAVIWAADQGVVNGMTSTTFQPNSSITREQTATILFRYAQKKGCDVTAQADLSEFIDQGKVSAYAEDALRWANAAGLINGSQNGDGVYLMPRDYATRAQLAAILMRYQRVMAA